MQVYRRNFNIPIDVVHEVDQNDQRHDPGIDPTHQLLRYPLLFVGQFVRGRVGIFLLHGFRLLSLANDIEILKREFCHDAGAMPGKSGEDCGHSWTVYRRSFATRAAEAAR